MSPAATTIATTSDVLSTSTVAAAKATAVSAAGASPAIAYQTVEVADLASTFADCVGE